MTSANPSAPASPSVGRDQGPPRLHIVVINYKTPNLTLDCLRSVDAERASVPGLVCSLVDNASGDGSAEQLAAAIEAESWGDWCRLIRSDTNRGFAGGNNLGLAAQPDAEHALLLNSDTVVHPGCLSHCLRVMDEQPDVGAMSCRLVSRDGSLQANARRFPSPPRIVAAAMNLPGRLPRLFGWADVEDAGWDRASQVRDVDWLGGAFLMIRGALLREIGPLDDDFFFYGEDIEFSHRVKRAGYRRLYDPRASITHLGGGSSDPARMAAQNRKAAHWNARYLVQRKCYGRGAAALARAADTLGWGARLLLLTLMGRRGTEGYDEARDTFELLRRPLF